LAFHEEFSDFNRAAEGNVQMEEEEKDRNFADSKLIPPILIF
jgi:hypothetical protein